MHIVFQEVCYYTNETYHKPTWTQQRIMGYGEIRIGPLIKAFEVGHELADFFSEQISASPDPARREGGKLLTTIIE